MYNCWAYDNLLGAVLEFGEAKSNLRTGEETISLHGASICFDLRQGFPIINRKFISFKSAVGEMLWMMSGSTNVRELRDKYGVSYWGPWDDEEWATSHGFQPGSIGKTYGHQLRSFNGKTLNEHSTRYLCTFKEDQLGRLLDKIRHDPSDRGMVVSLWNPLQLDEMKLRPCLFEFQILCNGEWMDMMCRMRSVDLFLGLPYNIAFYSTLLSLLALETGFRPRNLFFFMGDCHVYSNHRDQAEEYLSLPYFDSPTLEINKRENMFVYEQKDFALRNYQHGPKLKASVAV